MHDVLWLLGRSPTDQSEGLSRELVLREAASCSGLGSAGKSQFFFPDRSQSGSAVGCNAHARLVDATNIVLAGGGGEALSIRALGDTCRIEMSTLHLSLRMVGDAHQTGKCRIGSAAHARVIYCWLAARSVSHRLALGGR